MLEIYSSGTEKDKKHENDPMETTKTDIFDEQEEYPFEKLNPLEYNFCQWPKIPESHFINIDIYILLII